MKANEAQVRTAIDRAGAGALPFILLYGPDEAGAAALAARMTAAMGDGAERVDLDGATLKGDPARLADEAMSLSLFGGARHIRVSGVGEESLAAIEALLATEGGNPVVALAPAIKTTGALAKRVLADRRALALACYIPDGRAAEGIAGDIARTHGLRLAPGVAARLVQASGGDRAVLTREIEKLALYLDADTDRPHELDGAALDALGAGIDEGDAGVAVEALIAGDPARLGGELERLMQANVSPIMWLRALVRRLSSLAEMRGAVDAGEAVGPVMKRHRVFFREEPATAQALRRWTPAMLAEGIVRARMLERGVMTDAARGEAAAAQGLVLLARSVATRR